MLLTIQPSEKISFAKILNTELESCQQGFFVFLVFRSDLVLQYFL
jgi:hypothetical protein